VTVNVLPGSDAEAGVWATALEVAAIFADVPWVLVGAQMVMLLEREAGRASGRTTGDVDAMVDVRVVAGGMRAAAARLVAAGFAPHVALPEPIGAPVTDVAAGDCKALDVQPRRP
jgi:hypothetical protein